MSLKTVVGLILMLLLSLPSLAQEPASTRLAFAHNGGLYVLEAGSTNPTLIDDAPSDEYQAMWSPDGTKLAYLVSAGDYFVNTLKVWDGAQTYELVSAFATPLPMTINWTRDGNIIYMEAVGGAAQEFDSVSIYTIAPIPGSVPELITDQTSIRTGCGGGSDLPMDHVSWVENGSTGRPFLKQTAQGLIYPVACYAIMGLFRPSTQELISFAEGNLMNPALSDDERWLAGVRANYHEETNRIHLINLETLETQEMPIPFSPVQMAWGPDGSLYYSTVARVGNLMAGLSQDVVYSFPAREDESGVMAIAQNSITIFRITPEGTQTPVVEGLDAYEVGRIQVVGSTLYFSTLSNGTEWVAAVLAGSISADDIRGGMPYIHTRLYKVDLAAPGSGPILVQTDAGQFTAADPDALSAQSLPAFSLPTVALEAVSASSDPDLSVQADASQMCPGSPISRVQVGNLARVTFAEPGQVHEDLRVRSGPAGERIGSMAEGTEFTIIEGPTCGNDLTWWHIQTLNGSITGWVTEGMAPNDYYIEPINP